MLNQAAGMGIGQRRIARGATLIEVLVAVLVLSIGLLGLAMLQVQSMKHNADAYFRTQATLLAYDIIDRMRANSGAAIDYVANGAPTAEDCGASDGAACSSVTELAKYDLTEWYNSLNAALPVAVDPSTIGVVGNQVTVTIRWQERDSTKSRTWVVEL